LLKIISCNQGISQKELASRLDRDKTSIARSLKNLEKSHKIKTKLNRSQLKLLPHPKATPLLTTLSETNKILLKY